MLRIVTKSGRVLLKNACTLINNEWYEVGNRNKFESGEVYQIGAKFNFANGTSSSGWNPVLIFRVRLISSF